MKYLEKHFGNAGRLLDHGAPLSPSSCPYFAANATCYSAFLNIVCSVERLVMRECSGLDRGVDLFAEFWPSGLLAGLDAPVHFVGLEMLGLQRRVRSLALLHMMTVG